MAQLDEFNLRLKILESQISKPNDQEVVVTVGETFEANKCEKDKKEEEQIATKCVYINQGSKLKGCRTQRVPQESILEWARDILERMRDEPYDTANDITKKVRTKVPDFEGRVDPTVFSDWIASIEEYFGWYDMVDDRQVRFAKMKLVGLAKVCWSSVENNVRRIGQLLIGTWQDMKVKLQEKYIPA